MCCHPSMPIAPPITVPSVQKAMVRRPLTVPAAASTPERSRSCSSSTLPSSKNVRRRSSGSRGSSDSSTTSGAMIVIQTSCSASDVGRRLRGAQESFLKLFPSVLPEGERDVVPTESKRIVYRVLIVAGSGAAVHDVQVDVWVLVLQVQCWRDDA